MRQTVEILSVNKYIGIAIGMKRTEVTFLWSTDKSLKQMGKLTSATYCSNSYWSIYCTYTSFAMTDEYCDDGISEHPFARIEFTVIRIIESYWYFQKKLGGTLLSLLASLRRRHYTRRGSSHRKAAEKHQIYYIVTTESTTFIALPSAVLNSTVARWRPLTWHWPINRNGRGRLYCYYWIC